MATIEHTSPLVSMDRWPRPPRPTATVAVRWVLRVTLAVTAVVLLALAAAAPAGAQEADDDRDHIVVLTGRASVAAGETIDGVVILDGPAVIDGTVREQVVALHGDVLVTGTVEEEVIALDGRVVVTGSGRIGGDVVSRHRPVIEGAGAVDGTWERWDFDAFRRGVDIGGHVAMWIAVSASTLALGALLTLLAPRAARAVAAAGRENPGAALGWGLVLTFGLPIAAVLVMFTIVGLPLGIGLLAALGLIYAVGYTAAAWLLGRTVGTDLSPLLAFLAGWAILRAAAIVPVLGGLVSFFAVVVGLGALAVAAHRARGPVEQEPRPTQAARSVAA